MNEVSQFFLVGENLHLLSLFAFGAAVILVLLGVQKALKFLFSNENEYVVLLFSVICISSVTAIYFTSGNTMMWANILVLLVYWKFAKREPSNQDASVSGLVWPFIFLYVMFFLANVFTSIDFDAGIIRVSTYDSSFYARLVDFLMLHGVENYEMNPMHSDVIGVRLYHYTENWFAAFCKIGLADTPTIFIQQFVVIPIFFSMCVLAFYEAVRKQTVSSSFAMGFSLLVIGGVALPEITTLMPDGLPFGALRTWSPLTAPKVSIAYMILPMALAQTSNKRFEQQLLLYILLAVNYITFLPAVLTLFFVAAVYHYFRSKLNREVIVRAVVLVLAAALPILIWLFCNPVTAPEINVTLPGLNELLHFYLSHGISIFGVSVISLWLLFGPIALIILSLARKNLHVFVPLSSAAILVGGGIAAYILLGYEVESFQLFQNVAIPTLNVYFLLVLFKTLVHYGKTVRIACMSVLLFLLIVRFVSTPQPLTTVAEIQRIQRFFGKTDGVKTAFMRSKETMNSLRGKSPYLNPPAEPILAAINKYQPISINELSWNVGEDFYVKREAEYKRSSPLFNFLHEKKLGNQSINEVHRKFLKENDIRYLEVEPGAELAVPYNQIIDSLQMDNGTKVYKIVHEPIAIPD